MPMLLPDGPEGLRLAWRGLQHVPGGGRLFGKLIGTLAPYTGTIAPEVLQLRHGHASVLLRDRRAVRNHLNSLHAIALMNIAEVATGLALVYSLPKDTRAILTGLSITYHKKARGPITASASVDAPTSSERQELTIEGQLTNDRGEVVATAQARWLIGPA